MVPWGDRVLARCGERNTCVRESERKRVRERERETWEGREQLKD